MPRVRTAGIPDELEIFGSMGDSQKGGIRFGDRSSFIPIVRLDALVNLDEFRFVVEGFGFALGVD